MTILLLILGLIAGLIAGLFGVGGGIIFTPVLFFLFEQAGIPNSVPWAVASGLMCTWITSLASVVRQYNQQHLFVKEGLLLGFFGALGISLGKWVLLSPYYSRTEFIIVFSSLLFYSAVLMFMRGRKTETHTEATAEERSPLFNPKQASVTGIIGGGIASLAGVGGGGTMVPIMNLFFKQHFRKAVSISHLGMLMMISVGVLQLMAEQPELNGSGQSLTQWTLGYVDLGAVNSMGWTALIGAYGGAWLNHKVPRHYLQLGFGLLALIMGTRLLLTL
ncbi:MAG: Uncharacterised protein [Rhodothermaeota bacterium MED-G12]|jgi:uncharacterized protein|nr:MAG: Uncharacterised protein [Rhodothermaeota bacterium MED-G12]|tara:strand:+ start:2086 stop:2913 length:828 start_codon:yes stop_codon:yes gene_type:complete